MHFGDHLSVVYNNLLKQSETIHVSSHQVVLTGFRQALKTKLLPQTKSHNKVNLQPDKARAYNEKWSIKIWKQCNGKVSSHVMCFRCCTLLVLPIWIHDTRLGWAAFLSSWGSRDMARFVKGLEWCPTFLTWISVTTKNRNMQCLEMDKALNSSYTSFSRHFSWVLRL